MEQRYLLTLLIGLLVITPSFYAQWSNNLNENTIVSLFTTQPTLVSDSENGVIVFSQSRDINPLLRAVRISVQSRIRWPGLQGLRVSDALDVQWLRHPSGGDRFVLSDGQGGAYVAYLVGRIIGQEPEVGDIYAISGFVQRLDHSGNRLFGAEGLRLVPILPDTFLFEQRIMNMIPDGASGVYVLVATVARDSVQYNGVYLSRLGPNGATLWGVKKLTQRSETYLPYLDNALNLNLYEYPGETNPPGGEQDKFLKIDASSGNFISERPIEIGAGEYGFNAFFDFDQSDQGTAIFAFYDFRADTLRVQKLNGDGNKLWGEEPIKIAKDLFRRLAFEIHSDHDQGAYLWYQTIDSVLHIAHLSGKGEISWEKKFGPDRLGAFPTLIGRTSHRPMAVAPDGSAFILTDGFQQVTKILNRVRFSGRHASPIELRLLPVSTITPRWRMRTAVAPWFGKKSETLLGLRAQRVDRHGNLGGATPVEEGPKVPTDFLFEVPRPNPFNDTVQIVFSLPQASEVSLKIYNILGKEVITLKKEKLFEGRHQVLWNGTDKDNRKLPSGIYFMALSTGQILLTQKVLLLK